MKSWAKDGSLYSGMMLEEIANEGRLAMQGFSMTKPFAKTRRRQHRRTQCPTPITGLPVTVMALCQGGAVLFESQVAARCRSLGP